MIIYETYHSNFLAFVKIEHILSTLDMLIYETYHSNFMLLLQFITIWRLAPVSSSFLDMLVIENFLKDRRLIKLGIVVSQNLRLPHFC